MAQTSVDDDLVVDEYVALSCPHNPVVLVDDVIGRVVVVYRCSDSIAEGR